jgi:hypothetical protein
VYDMYLWNQPAGGEDKAAPAARRDRPARTRARADEAARAVQEALDRRDNGGASAASRDQ